MDAPAIEQTYGQWLRAELDARGWGSRTLARRMEPDPRKAEHLRRNLIKYQQDKHTPLPPMRFAIAAALGIGRAEYEAIDGARVAAAEVAAGDPFRRGAGRDVHARAQARRAEGDGADDAAA